MPEYKHIEFAESATSDRKRWWCMAKKDDIMLGFVEQYGPWRQPCFFPEPDIVFSESCLLDIADFLRRRRVAR